MHKTAWLIVTCWFALVAIPFQSLAEDAVDQQPDPSQASEADALREAIGSHLRRLDRTLQELVRSTERQGTENDGLTSRLATEAEHINRRLRQLEVRILGSSDQAILDLLPNTRSLRQLAQSLLQTKAQTETQRRDTHPGLRQTVGLADNIGSSLPSTLGLDGVPTNDDCANALPISPGSFVGSTDGATTDGSASCGAL